MCIWYYPFQISRILLNWYYHTLHESIFHTRRSRRNCQSSLLRRPRCRWSKSCPICSIHNILNKDVAFRSWRPCFCGSIWHRCSVWPTPEFSCSSNIECNYYKTNSSQALWEVVASSNEYAQLCHTFRRLWFCFHRLKDDSFNILCNLDIPTFEHFECFAMSSWSFWPN